MVTIIYNMTLSQKIKIFRQANNLTQEQFAKLSKIHSTIISKIENGKQKLGGEILKKLLEVGAISKDDLIQNL